jgi:hypothetical protein
MDKASAADALAERFREDIRRVAVFERIDPVALTAAVAAVLTKPAPAAG